MISVQEVMAKNPAVCLSDTPVSEAAAMMERHDCGALPVVESREAPRPLGIITDRDIVVRLVAQRRDPLTSTVKDAMTESAVTVTAETSLATCADLMEQHQVRRIPVVEAATGHVIGIVSQADVALNTSPDTAGELLREVSEDSDTTMIGDYSG